MMGSLLEPQVPLSLTKTSSALQAKRLRPAGLAGLLSTTALYSPRVFADESLVFAETAPSACGIAGRRPHRPVSRVCARSPGGRARRSVRRRVEPAREAPRPRRDARGGGGAAVRKGRCRLLAQDSVSLDKYACPKGRTGRPGRLYGFSLGLTHHTVTPRMHRRSIKLQVRRRPARATNRGTAIRSREDACGPVCASVL